MLRIPDIIEARHRHSEERLRSLVDRLKAADALKNATNLCIYVTGSYGRLEAGVHSDLDLFLLARGAATTGGVSRIAKTLIDAELINTCRELRFPDFSNDGQYLELHYLDDVNAQLGSSSDDYSNVFTARLLLLLESRPLYNEGLYGDIIQDVINTYYRDYPDHEVDFRPVFLVNDMVRFWKTLCLNYENKRERLGPGSNKKPKAHLRNLKLKYSRLLTCYSTIMLLSKNHEVLTPENLAQLVRLPPLSRLEQSAQVADGGEDLCQRIMDNYAWFLERTDRELSETLTWISDRRERDAAFGKAREFGKNMYDLLLQVTHGSEIMRYLVM